MVKTTSLYGPLITHYRRTRKLNYTTKMVKIEHLKNKFQVIMMNHIIIENNWTCWILPPCFSREQCYILV